MKKIIASILLMITIIGMLTSAAFATCYYSTATNYDFDYSYPSSMQYFFGSGLYVCYTARNLSSATSYATARTYGMGSVNDTSHTAVTILTNHGYTQHRVQQSVLSNNGNGYNLFSGQSNGTTNKDVIHLQHWVYIEDYAGNELLYSRDVQ